MDNCIICKSKLEKRQQVRRARMRNKNGKDLGEKITYKAWCSNCEFYLWKHDMGNKEGLWNVSNIKLGELESELSENDFFNLKDNIEKKLEYVEDDDYKLTEKERWSDFISIKKENDKIYRYLQRDGEYTINGYAIRRGKYIIGEFIDKIKIVD